MNLNIDNTSIVVLSACETGLGEVVIGEGVYGLQRAFTIAGDRTIIMPLWKVDDSSTQELMIKFYENWLAQGMTKHEALSEAQHEMKKQYPHPYNWGGFCNYRGITRKATWSQKTTRNGVTLLMLSYLNSKRTTFST